MGPVDFMLSSILSLDSNIINLPQLLTVRSHSSWRSCCPRGTVYLIRSISSYEFHASVQCISTGAVTTQSILCRELLLGHKMQGPFCDGEDIVILFYLPQTHCLHSVEDAFHGLGSEPLWAKVLWWIWMSFMFEKLEYDTFSVSESVTNVSFTWIHLMTSVTLLSSSKRHRNTFVWGECASLCIQQNVPLRHHKHHTGWWAESLADVHVLRSLLLETGTHHCQESIEIQSWIILYTPAGSAFVAKQHKGSVRGCRFFTQLWSYTVCSHCPLIGCQLSIVSYRQTLWDVM